MNSEICKIKIDMDLTFASCEHPIEERRQMRNDAWALAKSFEIFISPNWSVSCNSKRNDSIYILKIPFVVYLSSAQICTVEEEEEFESVLFPLRSVYAATTRGFRDGGGGQVPSVCACCVLLRVVVRAEVKYKVCVLVMMYLCTCCMLLRVVVGAGVKYQGKRSDDTNCEVHPKSPPMFNSWVSSFGKFSILCFPPNSSPSHWTDTWHHCPF